MVRGWGEGGDECGVRAGVTGSTGTWSRPVQLAMYVRASLCWRLPVQGLLYKGLI